MLTPSFLNEFTRGQSSSVLEMAAKKIKKKHTRRLKNIENSRVHFTEAVSERQGSNNADIGLYLVAFLFCPFHIILAHSK